MLMYVHIIGLMVNLKQFGDIHCPKNYVQKKPQKKEYMGILLSPGDTYSH